VKLLFGHKVIGAHTLNFGRIFEFCFFKLLGSSVWVACTLASLGHSQTRVNIFLEQHHYGPKYGHPKKLAGRVDMRHLTQMLVDQSSASFSLNARGIVDNAVFRLSISRSVLAIEV